MRISGQSGQREAGRGENRIPEFLIANLELEFHLSPIRISNLNFSNRKFLAIFPLKLVPDGASCAAFSSPQPPASSRQTLIVTPRLEFLATRTKQTSNQSSNRYKSRFSRSGCDRRMPVARLAPNCLRPSRITSYKSPVTSHASPAPCIAPPPRLTWRLATLPPRSSANAIQSQSFAIYPDVLGTYGFCSAASSCKPASNRRGAATSRRHHKLAEKLEARAC
jgi:hypothetical protein